MNEISYEDYKEIIEKILKEGSELITEKQFAFIKEFSKNKIEFEQKIDKIATESPYNYISDTAGYYEIINYCIQRIRAKDEKYKTNFSV